MCIDRLGGGGYVEVNVIVLIGTNQKMEGEQFYETSCVLNYMNFEYIDIKMYQQSTIFGLL
jgi:hypothetical protein